MAVVDLPLTAFGNRARPWMMRMCLVFVGVEHWRGTNQSGLQTEDWKA